VSFFLSFILWLPRRRRDDERKRDGKKIRQRGPANRSPIPPEKNQKNKNQTYRSRSPVAWEEIMRLVKATDVKYVTPLSLFFLFEPSASLSPFSFFPPAHRIRHLLTSSFQLVPSTKHERTNLHSAAASTAGSVIALGIAWRVCMTVRLGVLSISSLLLAVHRLLFKPLSTHNRPRPTKPHILPTPTKTKNNATAAPHHLWRVLRRRVPHDGFGPRGAQGKEERLKK
jgi:hypothetical protein